MLSTNCKDEGASSESQSVEQSSPSPTPTGEVPNESLPDSTSAQPSEVPFEQQPDHSPSPSPQPSTTPIVPDSIPEHTGENLGDHSSNDQSLSGNEDAMTLQNVRMIFVSSLLSKAKGSSDSQRKRGFFAFAILHIQEVCEVPKEMMIEIKRIDEVSLVLKMKLVLLRKDLVPTLKKLVPSNPKLSTDDFKVNTDEQMESTDDQVDASGRRSLNLVKKFKLIKSDESWLGMSKMCGKAERREINSHKIAEEEAANEALINNIDDVKARIEADRILAEKLQEQEREQFTIEERAKFLHDTIAAQRKFLAQQRSQAIRNKPPTKNQLRNQMMTYIKHVGNYKHADLKSKKFEDIQASGLSKSEFSDQREEPKAEVKEIEDKEEESTRKRKLVCLGTKPQFDDPKKREIIDVDKLPMNEMPEGFLKEFFREILRFCSNQMNKMSFGAHSMNGRESEEQGEGSEKGIECWLTTHQQMVINSPYEELSIPEQTAIGKGTSIVDGCSLQNYKAYLVGW
ncbi:hypothetical protein Tco_1006760 [Tanacetum coccineum]|uniref:Uncharacterized protein n=1 Tax=Tanacetum coccineum TaxID=301880 RepID=A0ABQ5FIS1_9ASTR